MRTVAAMLVCLAQTVCLVKTDGRRVLCSRAMATHDNDRFGTLAIHAGQQPDPTTGAVMTPVYFTSTYAQSGPGEHKGFEYSRTHNPTRYALRGQPRRAGGRQARAWPSPAGSRRPTRSCTCSRRATTWCVSDDLYGGTFRLFDKVFRRLGIEFTLRGRRPTRAPSRRRCGPNTKLVWVETPTNPMLKIVRPRGGGRGLQASASVISAVDNTFMTPFFQRPLELGADVVAHSMTKYLNGHSDVVGGALVCGDDELREQLAFLQNAVGAVPAPMDSFLVLRGTKTLHVRMERHE